jgi:hypothetical protein
MAKMAIQGKTDGLVLLKMFKKLTIGQAKVLQSSSKLFIP